MTDVQPSVCVLDNLCELVEMLWCHVLLIAGYCKIPLLCADGPPCLKVCKSHFMLSASRCQRYVQFMSCRAHKGPRRICADICMQPSDVTTLDACVV